VINFFDRVAEKQEDLLMPQATQHSSPEVLPVVITTLTAVLPTLPGAGPDTHLMGHEAVLDSVGFVSLLVSLEQNLGNRVDLVSSFMDVGTVAETDHPFQTVASLSDHIHRLLAARQ
jgi:hypothetical protein